MDKVNYKSILGIIQQLNSFADQAEADIIQTRTKFDTDKTLLSDEHNASLSKLNAKFKSDKQNASDKSKNLLNEATNIKNDILDLDAKLVEADKYYMKTKKKKEEELAGKQSEKYSSNENYFSALKEIREQFNQLSKKYSEDILPALINGLNYILSSKRKKDYEELIVLKNTVESLITEVNNFLPELTQESIAVLQTRYDQQINDLQSRYSRDYQFLQSNYEASLETFADDICQKLDAILPDDAVSFFRGIIDEYEEGLTKVNVSRQKFDEAFILGFIDYPLNFYIQSPILISLIKDKCVALLTGDDVLRFPIICPKSEPITWLFKNDGTNNAVILQYTHSVMLAFLSSVPTSQLTFSIVDVEHHSNSIAPFFELKKKLPSLFDEKIFITKEDVYKKMSSLNEYIGQMLQNELGGQYENIYDYANDNPEYTVSVQLFLLYDFPKGFDEQSLAELRNILRNGHRCGIYTIIYQETKANSGNSYNQEEGLKIVDELCTVVNQENNGLFLNGLNVVYFALPQNHELLKFFNKYLLIYEGIKNKGLAFPPVIKKLMDISDATELENHISLIKTMLRSYNEQWNRVPALNAGFPDRVMLGTVQYPIDIFSDSFSFEQIKKEFGVANASSDEILFAELPLTCDLSSIFNLFINCPENNNREILNFTHHILWSFLTFLPISKVNMCIFDGEQRGNSIIPFLDFRKKIPELFDEQIYTSQDMMAERLLKINKYIDEFIQEKLGNRYANILEYNANTPTRTEPIIMLMIYDFPKGFDSRSIDLLMNILKNGNKCGVYTVMCYNPNVTYSRYDSIDERLEEIMKYCASIDYKDRKYMLLPYNLPIKVNNALTNNDIDQFVSDYADVNNSLKKKGLSFKDILPDDLFESSSARNLTIPIGIGDGESIVKLILGEGSSHHGLIAGATGSGKSTLLHTIIMSAMLNHSPDQLHLYLMDFKSGTEFKVYESVKIPHIQLLALDAMQEFGESILENLVSEMTRRSELFKNAGQTSLASYTKETGKTLPRILVIMDEFQILFNDSSNRKVAMNCAELTKRIVTEGRAFGIHLLMATQTTKVLSDLTLSHGTIEQMRVRIGLKCGEDDARYLFSDRNDLKALEMMKGPIGTAVMNLEYMESSNIGLRAAYCDDVTQQEMFQKIADKYNDTPSNLQTFEGNRTVPLLDYFAQKQIGISSSTPVSIHMGNLIKVAPPFVMQIDRRKKHNLLICGANEKMSENVINIYILSALINTNSFVYCIDGESMVGDNFSEEIYKCYSRFGLRFKLATNRGQIITFIHEIFDLYSEWKKSNTDDQIFVFIKNLQFLDIIKKMFQDERIDESEFLSTAPEDYSDDPFDFGDKPLIPPVSEMMLRLIDDGSGFGINFIVSCSEYQTVKTSMYFGENVLAKFPERIIFSLGDNDADSMIDNVSVANLRDNTVYYTDSVKNTFQLKPYVMPRASELEQYLDRLL